MEDEVKSVEVYEKHDEAWETYKQKSEKVYQSKCHEDERHLIKFFQFFKKSFLLFKFFRTEEKFGNIL